MSIIKTGYTIISKDTLYAVVKNNKMIAQGFSDKESALHAIWVMESRNINNFFVENNGEVAMVERDTL